MKSRKFLLCLAFLTCVGGSAPSVNGMSFVARLVEGASNVDRKIVAVSLAEIVSNFFGDSVRGTYEDGDTTKAVREIYGFWGKFNKVTENKWASVLKGLFNVFPALVLFNVGNEFWLTLAGAAPSFLLGFEMVGDLACWASVFLFHFYRDDWLTSAERDLRSAGENGAADVVAELI